MRILKYVCMMMAVIMPTMLRAWGDDIVVHTSRRVDDRTPVCYDIIWPYDTVMVVAVTCNHSSSSLDSSYTILYKSSDGGVSWTSSSPIIGPRAEKIQLAHLPVEDKLLILFLAERGDAYVVPVSYSDLQPVGFGVIEHGSADTTIDAQIATIEINGQWYCFVSTTVRSSSSDNLRIYKVTSDNISLEREVVYSNTGFYHQYRDLGVFLKNDTIFVIGAFDVVPRGSSGTLTIGLHIRFYDTNGNSLTGLSRFFTVGEGQVSFIPLSLGLGPRGYGMLIYEVNGDLKYIYTTDYFVNPSSTLDFPYNLSDSTETLPFTRHWEAFIPIPYPRLIVGFNLVFVRGVNVYFVESTCESQDVSWGNLELVSNQIPRYYFGFMLNYLMRPKLCTRTFASVPAVIWNSDYYHYISVPPFFVYDSTQFIVDNMIASDIEEASSSGSGNQNFRIFCNKRNLYLSFDDYTTVEYKGLIYSTDGRIVREFEIPRGLRSLSVDLPSIPSGVYFLMLKREDRLAIVKKFMFFR
ncbi:MAG: hypothetical protein ABIM31_00495 [candidate division WOR-3 bacterium]